jgi:hypothetical protein
MKSITVLFIAFFITNLTLGQLWLVDPLEAIYPDKNELNGYSDSWEIDVPANGIADVHVLLKLPKGASYSFTATLEGRTLENVWSELIDVPVEQNTGLDSRTEQYLGKNNPYVIRRSPFRIYEVIKPLGITKLKATSNFMALRLAIPPEIVESAEKHAVKIEVNTQDHIYRGHFTINRHQVALPKLSDSRFFYTNWFNLTQMEQQHQLIRWSDDWFDMLHKYAELMAYGRQNSITLPQELFRFENDELFLEEDKMLRFISVFKRYGFTHFEAPHLMNRGSNDDWGDPELKVALTGRRYYKENGKKDIDTLMRLIHRFVITNQLTNNWLQHISDEPTLVQAECYREVAKQIKSIYPEVKIMEATNDRNGLVGAVDVWCPLINDFQENESFFKKRVSQGERILVYTCLIPGGNWLNRTLDMEKIRQVYFGWGAARYNTNGYLHWGLNQYQAPPFEQSVVKHPSPQAGPNNYLPAGDTHIVYPGKEMPLSSIRFEAHRMGIEDYELLNLYKQKKPHEQQELIRKLFRDYTDYDTSLSNYREVKKNLLVYTAENKK